MLEFGPAPTFVLQRPAFGGRECMEMSGIMKWSNSDKFNVAHSAILVEKHVKTGGKHETEKSSHGEC